MSDSIRLVELAKSLIKETFIYAQDVKWTLCQGH